jgi:periplasmic divalent cation tolerance protein
VVDRPASGRAATGAGEPTAPAEALVVLIAIPAADAPGLARKLVEERRAACVNQLPGVRSTYVWDGRVEEAGETLLLVKTTVAGYPALERRVRELHPYDVPELLAVRVAAGFEPYLDWLKRSVTTA